MRLILVPKGPHRRGSFLISMQLSMPIFMYDKEGKSTIMTLEQLLPMSFGPEKLLTTEELSNGLSQ